MPGPEGVPRADIITLLAEGHSNREIHRRTGAYPARIARIRTELGLPKYDRSGTLTLDQKWATYTHPTPGGHLKWTGPRGAYSTPILRHHGTRHQARAVAFHHHYGRTPIGQVRPTCGQAWCVAPGHVADQLIRAANQRADAKYPAIFGRTT
jgi:hypothetical protein